MSDEEKAAKVSIGFEGGQVLVVRLTPPQLTKLREALDTTKGWYDLEADDGALALQLGDVVYLRTESDEHRVGFGL
jgi:hypothetical protein